MNWLIETCNQNYWKVDDIDAELNVCVCQVKSMRRILSQLYLAFWLSVSHVGSCVCVCVCMSSPIHNSRQYGISFRQIIILINILNGCCPRGKVRESAFTNWVESWPNQTKPNQTKPNEEWMEQSNILNAIHSLTLVSIVFTKNSKRVLSQSFNFGDPKKR